MQKMQKTLGDIEKEEEHAFPKFLDRNLAPNITLWSCNQLKSDSYNLQIEHVSFESLLWNEIGTL